MAAPHPPRPRHAGVALLVFLLFFASAVPTVAQEKTAPALSIGAGRFFSTAGWEVGFSSFSLAADTARYQVAGERVPRLVPVSTVLRVQEQTGHAGATSAVVGGVCGLIGSAAGAWLSYAAIKGALDWLSAMGNSPATSDDHPEVGLAIAVSVGTIMGTVVGYRLGARQNRYSTVYEDPSLERR